ncbi:hypothetical protein EG68_04230 [Paragonimus skrjabini miyazakii]|uniref:C2H2-type domain-containing protein n=1 Tax=Paragonimus skrjabini miyazakii TaxID=59628 RepID=A0A8S9Z1W7_9TREM|nr:hypothetical protein EG68_04230 [Paragonimus skrjabini miyazakii]
MKRVHQNSRRSAATTSPSKAFDNLTQEPAITTSNQARKLTKRRISTRQSVAKHRRSPTVSSTVRPRRTSLEQDRLSSETQVESDGMPSHMENQRVTTKPSDGTHRCKICGTHFDRSVLLKAHLLEHGNDRPFPCFTCNIRFTTKWNLMKHQKCRSHRVVQAKAAVIGLEKSAKSM